VHVAAIIVLAYGLGARAAGSASQGQGQNFDAQLQQQEQIDAVWRAASDGHMKMTKTTYKSRADGMTIPAFVFQPLTIKGPKQHAALVWVHPDIRGRVYAYYFPYVREAVARGYTVIAPEYRGSVGYGQAHYDAIDYGGAEVDDVITATEYLKANCPEVDPARIGIIGWSHGGMITLLSITREPALFKTAAALVPVTNLFQRLAWKGVARQHQLIDPANRYGGLPGDSAAVNQVYKDRSPIYQIDKLRIPLLVHVTRNDQDVNIEEDMQLVDALRARKPELSETKVYDNPQGGHLFDRQYAGTSTRGADSQSLATYTPTNTPEQVDSWTRVWAFLEKTMKTSEVISGKGR
jgi:dipeptidyl aminopeptidase/acylaminoacyl peptidase